MSSSAIAPVRDEPALHQWQRVSEAAFEHDFSQLPADPMVERLPDVLGTGPDAGERTELWMATVDGNGVAAAAVGLPTRDNLATASIDLRVHPEHRSRGHGSTLLDALLAHLGRVGRPRVLFQVPSPYPAGEGPLEPLLRRRGARPVLREMRRTVDLSRHPIAALRPAPDGYRLHQWVDVAPEALVGDAAVLKQRMSTDAPLEELDWDPEVWDAARYREEEEATRLRGRLRLSTAVEDCATGRLAGLTEIAISHLAPQVGYQWATLVLPEHRGRGLGLLLKTHNHHFTAARSPQTRWLNTWNAESNSYMVQVNDVLGYEPREYWTEWQLDR